MQSSFQSNFIFLAVYSKTSHGSSVCQQMSLLRLSQRSWSTSSIVSSLLSLTPYIIMKSYVLFVQIPLESSRFCYVHMTKSSSLGFHLTNEKLDKNMSGSCQVCAQFGWTTFGSAREHFVTNTEQLFRFPEAKTTLLVCETQIVNTTERKEDIRVLFLLRHYPNTDGTTPNISSEISSVFLTQTCDLEGQLTIECKDSRSKGLVVCLLRNSIGFRVIQWQLDIERFTGVNPLFYNGSTNCPKLISDVPQGLMFVI